MSEMIDRGVMSDDKGYHEQVGKILGEAASLDREARIKMASVVAEDHYTLTGIGCLGKLNEIIGEARRRLGIHSCPCCGQVVDGPMTMPIQVVDFEISLED